MTIAINSVSIHHFVQLQQKEKTRKEKTKHASPCDENLGFILLKTFINICIFMYKYMYIYESF